MKNELHWRHTTDGVTVGVFKGNVWTSFAEAMTDGETLIIQRRLPACGGLAEAQGEAVKCGLRLRLLRGDVRLESAA